MKRVLILRTAGNKPRKENKDWGSLVEGIQSSLQGSAEVQIAALTDLIYDANETATGIWHHAEKWDIADFDLVIFRRVGDDMELAIAAAHYLSMKGVRFIDDYLHTLGRGKLAGAFLRVANDLPVPRTLHTSPQHLEALFESTPPFPFPFILKADTGSKGRDNFLIHSQEELGTVLNNTDIALVAQPFLANDGDYRVLVLNETPALVIHRKGKEGSHLNNTSQGGAATIVDLNALSEQAIADAIKAAQLERLAVAGVDILIERASKKHYILEVNRSPQLATGAFTDEKLKVYANMIGSILAGK